MASARKARPAVRAIADRARAVVVVAIAVVALNGCRAADQPRIVQPGAPGEPSRVASAAPRPETRKPTAADIEFMTGMIAHHAQALDMVALIGERSTTEAMRMLGLRIRVSQEDEIRLMRAWLRDHNQPEPDEHAHHAGHLMPGMLTPDEMARLAGLKGADFDRFFLEMMIKHHEGAVRMVETLMASPGAAQTSSVSAFAADVIADQSAEINRMRAMRAAMGKPPRSPR